MARPTAKARGRPSKPYLSFPLTAHNNGQWCKKIRGKVHFFGTWEDPQAALDRYLHVAEDLHGGRQPRIATDTVTIKDICNHFLSHQLQKQQAGEISARWFEDCRRVIEHFARFFGSQRPAVELRPADFARYRQQLSSKGLAGHGGLGVHAMTRTLTIVRGMLKYAYENELLDRPLRYGTALARPSTRVRRKQQRKSCLENGKRFFAPDEARTLVENAALPLRAMILLGLNGGFGNSDCAQLPTSAVDLQNAVVEFDRPKTGIQRVVPLWPETTAALRAVAAHRPTPADDDAQGLVFLTTFGRPWLRECVHRDEAGTITKVIPVDAVGQEFDKLLRKLDLKRKGLGFYALRHTFRTWADEMNDQHAIHRIMGHAVPGMSGIYVQEIGLDRLRAVVAHVRQKLFHEQ